jgi:hypothetical protein
MPRTHNRNRIVSLKKGTMKTRYSHAKNEARHLNFLPYTKANSERIKDLKIKTQNYKTAR